jgi:hypothetical protein
MWASMIEEKNKQQETFLGPRYVYESSEIAWRILTTIIFTPITAVLDILLSPLELIVFILTKVIDKQRKKQEDE